MGESPPPPPQKKKKRNYKYILNLRKEIDLCLIFITQLK